MKVSKLSAIFGLLFCCSSLASAEIFEVEGPLQSVALGSPNTIVCNGVTIEVPDGIPISSPTASLSFAQLADPTPFINSGKAGFTGGTCIVDGNNDSGPNVADDVFVELAENVLLGAVTSNDPNTTWKVNNFAD